MLLLTPGLWKVGMEWNRIWKKGNPDYRKVLLPLLEMCPGIEKKCPRRGTASPLSRGNGSLEQAIKRDNILRSAAKSLMQGKGSQLASNSALLSTKWPRSGFRTDRFASQKRSPSLNKAASSKRHEAYFLSFPGIAHHDFTVLIHQFQDLQ